METENIDEMKETARRKIKKLVDDFLSIPESEINSKVEEHIKFHYIEPMLEILGWKRKDIEKEERVLKGRADYILKINNEDALVIEAKKTGVTLSEVEGRQAVSYAYHKKIKFAVLTNFKELRIYHALSNIRNINKNLMKDDRGYLQLHSENFEEQFERLWLISRYSFEQNKLNEYLSKKDERLARPIDMSILADLLQVREWLSKDLKNLRNYLKDPQIDEIVQILIDRLIFIRSVEDRGLEESEGLQKIVDDFQKGLTSKRIWETLLIKFNEFDKSYNSKLFAKGLLEKEGFFTENVLMKAIKALYYGTSGTQEKYMFDVIPGDLLGNIYEQYLGTILRGTEKRVKLEIGKGKRKSMGIYYTPSYIVDYIVKHGVGEYIKDKSIDEILDVKILDPACGSGSFLIRAFDEVCGAIEKKLKKGEKSKKFLVFKSYKDRLNLGQKITILTNCIYGVDLDEKAVELAELNLLLKLLEDETSVSHKHLLPSMKDNIKCGNSLVEDFSVDKNKAFNWKAQFQKIFRDRGGFDVIVGNPPYVRIQTNQDNKDELKYIKEKYLSAGSGNYDIYVVFVERGLELLNNKGKLAFILPHKFFNSKYGEPLRSIIANGKQLSHVVHFGHQQVFVGATTYTCLMFLDKTGKDKFGFLRVDDLEKWRTSRYAKEGFIKNEDVDSGEWNFVVGKGAELFKRLKSMPHKLGDVADIFVGLQTSADDVYTMKFIRDNGNTIDLESKYIDKKWTFEKGIVFPIVSGTDVRKYGKLPERQYIIFPYDLNTVPPSLIDFNEISKKYPKTAEYLLMNKILLENRERGKFKIKQWYKFGRDQNIGRQNTIKICVPRLVDELYATYDSNGSHFLDNVDVGGVVLKEKYKKQNLIYLLGLLNSKLLRWYFPNISAPFRGGWMSANRQFLSQLPIKIIDLSNKTDSEHHNRIIEIVKNRIMLTNKFDSSTGREKDMFKQKINQVDWEIDNEIFRLYKISKDDQKIIDEEMT